MTPEMDNMLAKYRGQSSAGSAVERSVAVT